MSTKKKGILTTFMGYDKHLRKFGKKFFWKAERQAVRKLIINKKKNVSNS